MSNMTTGKRYRRRYADGENVSSSDLIAAYRAAAELVAEGGDAYLPLFERLDREVRAREEQKALREHALRIAKQDASSSPGGSNTFG